MKIKNIFLFVSVCIIVLFLHIFLFKTQFVQNTTTQRTFKPEVVTLKLDYIKQVRKVEPKQEVKKENKKVEKSLLPKKVLPEKKSVSKVEKKIIQKIPSKEIVKNITKPKKVTQKNVEQSVADVTKEKQKTIQHDTSVLEKKIKPSKEEMSVIQKKYFEYIYKTILAKRVYPKLAKRMGQQGECQMNVKISAKGEISQVSFIKQSAFSSLNKACTEIFQSIKSFKPIPKELGLEQITLTIPIKYSLLKDN